MRILYVCPSSYWSTQERLVLTDALVAKRKGHEVMIYGLRDSFLQQYALKLGIDFIIHKGLYKKKKFGFGSLKPLRRFFIPGELAVDLVHGYGFETLIEIAFQIRSSPHIPLLGTLTFELRRSWRHLWLGALIGRVDQYILTSRDMLESTATLLGVAKMKLQVSGIGLPSPKRESENQSFTQEFYTPDGAHLLGVHIGVDEEDLAKSLTLLHALRALNGSQKQGDFYLVLFCEKPWKEHVLHEPLKGAAYDLGCAEYTIFTEQEDMPGHDFFAPVRAVQEQVDIWLGLPSEEPLEDLWISAILMERAVVIPRTVSSMELLRHYPGCGETYMIGDARELRGKIEKVIAHHDHYESSLAKNVSKLAQVYNPNSYKESILGLYERSLAKRRRLVRHRSSR